MLEFEQDLLEELLGDRLTARDFGNEDGLAVMAGADQRHEGAQLAQADIHWMIL